MTDVFLMLSVCRTDHVAQPDTGASKMSNATGGRPILTGATQCRSRGVKMVVMVMAARRCTLPADVQQLDIDFYAFSAHKLYGPTGTWRAVRQAGASGGDVAPLGGGGKMIRDASFEGFTTAPSKSGSGDAERRRVIGLSAAGMAVRYRY